jgi:transposase
VNPAERTTRTVLSVLAGEISVAEAARREKVSEQSIGRWKADFLEGGKTALAWNRPLDVNLGIADPTIPTYQNRKILPCS